MHKRQRNLILIFILINNTVLYGLSGKNYKIVALCGSDIISDDLRKIMTDNINTHKRSGDYIRSDYSSEILTVKLEQTIVKNSKYHPSIILPTIDNTSVYYYYDYDYHITIFQYYDGESCDGPLASIYGLYNIRGRSYELYDNTKMLIINYAEATNVLSMKYNIDREWVHRISYIQKKKCEPHIEYCGESGIVTIKNFNESLSRLVESNLDYVLTASIDDVWYNYTTPVFCGNGSCHSQHTITNSIITASNAQTAQLLLHTSDSFEKIVISDTTALNVDVGLIIPKIPISFGFSNSYTSTTVNEKSLRLIDTQGYSYTYGFTNGVTHENQHTVTCDGKIGDNVVIQYRTMIMYLTGNRCILSQKYIHKNILKYECYNFQSNIYPSNNKLYVPSYRCYRF